MDILNTVLSPNFAQCCSVLSLHETELNTTELVEFLQNAAGEQLTTYRRNMAHEFGIVDQIVTTDFETMYAYKRGDYQRCLQLSTQNVHRLLYAYSMSTLPLLPELIQLLDDDIVSLTALARIVHPESSEHFYYIISQITVSLYLMTQCQLKLRHSVTSLAQTLEYIEVSQSKHPRRQTFDQLMHKLAERKIMKMIVSEFETLH